MELVKNMMKSVLIEQPGCLKIAQKARPKLDAGEVRIRVKYASICGSDIHIWRGHNPFAQYPRIIGHEFCGIIEDVADEQHRHRIGEFVVIDPVVSCGHCYPCSVNRPNVCSSLKVIGVHRDGGFSQYVNVPHQNAYSAPKNIAQDLCCLVEPFTIAANITAFLQPTSNDIALIYGAGPMGLTAIQVLKQVYQVSEVIVVDRISERLSMALNNGADSVINNKIESVISQLQGKQPTLIIDAACHPSIFSEATQVISPAGRIGLLGFSAESCTITQQSLTSKELSVFTSRLNSHRFPQVIEWFEQGKVTPEKLITDRFPLDRAEEAMSCFERNVRDCCKVILTID